MTLKKCVSQTVFVGLILLIFSLAIYSETDTGWYAEDVLLEIGHKQSLAIVSDKDLIKINIRI